MSGPEAIRRYALTFTAALRAVRQRRGLKVGEIAQRMEMARRTYEYFEAHGRLDLAKLKRFGVATDSDIYAILFSVALGSPDFAARCADNRLAMRVMEHLNALDLALGDRLNNLDPRTIEETLAAAMATLLRAADPDAEDPPP